mmetsp:Transcript_82359/g.241777  ORF Transcript_82359/g.241777 Transcript_82359/m.241777 type:complete len:109 (-) Transcript_82359:103-429(-)
MDAVAASGGGSLEEFMKGIAGTRRLVGKNVHTEALGYLPPKPDASLQAGLQAGKRAMVSNTDGRRYLSLSDTPDGEPQYKPMKGAPTFVSQFYTTKTPDCLTGATKSL